MFRVSTTPIIRSTQNCNYSLRYWSNFLCSYPLPLQRGQAWPVPEAVVTVLCTPDDGCVWHPKRVEWTCRIIDCFVLYLVGQLLIFTSNVTMFNKLKTFSQGFFSRYSRCCSMHGVTGYSHTYTKSGTEVNNNVRKSGDTEKPFVLTANMLSTQNKQAKYKSTRNLN